MTTQRRSPRKSLQYLESIQSSAREMGELVDDLLSFSKTSRVQLAHSQVNLNDLFDDIKSELHSDIKERSIEWHIAPLPEVDADPSLLRLAFSNIVSNAVKYSRPRNPARIEIGAQETDT